MKKNAKKDVAESTRGRAAALLLRIADLERRSSWAGARPRGLHPAQAKILGFLRGKGPCRLREVASALSVTPATASESVRVLGEKGLIAKGADETDGRAVVITLTEAGEKTAGKAGGSLVALAEAVGMLPKGERKSLLRGLERVVEALEAAAASKA